MKRELSVVMTMDQNYILQIRVAIWSLLASAGKETFFHIHILCTNQLVQEEREKIYDIQKQWGNVDICFIEVNKKIFQNSKTTAYVSESSFYRLIISDVVDGERCLFLDGDILVNTDLTKVYNTDLTGKYMAGVRDCMFQCNMKEYESHGKEIGIPTMGEYVNAGVLLMNLEMIRDNNISKAFISCLSDYYKFMDQDIINKCCFGKIGNLDLKYNFFADYYKRTERLRGTSFSQREIEEADKQISILHFPGKYKPWNFTRMRGAHQWWESARKALTPEDYDALYQHAVENTCKNDWESILGRCKEAEDIVIVGFSDIGRDMADSLKCCGIKTTRCFCDNSKEKQLSEYDHLTVFSVDEAYQRYPQALWINTSQNSAGEISKQLTSKGIVESSILVYTYKTEQYYDNLDERYQAYEAGQLALKQYGRKE